MADKKPVWEAIVRKHGLQPLPYEQLRRGPSLTPFSVSWNMTTSRARSRRAALVSLTASIRRTCLKDSSPTSAKTESFHSRRSQTEDRRRRQKAEGRRQNAEPRPAKPRPLGRVPRPGLSYLEKFWHNAGVGLTVLSQIPKLGNRPRPYSRARSRFIGLLRREKSRSSWQLFGSVSVTARC